jgi:hypothetical protein
MARGGKKNAKKGRANAPVRSTRSGAIIGAAKLAAAKTTPELKAAEAPDSKRASAAAKAPSSKASDGSWLNDFEPSRDDHDRGAVHAHAAAQVSERLAPRLRTSEAEAAWTAATSNEHQHRARRHGLEVLLANGILPAAHGAGGSSIKPEYAMQARDAINELCDVDAVSTSGDHVRAGHAESASPRLVMPLIVEPKPGRPGKFRLINDCRHLSKLLDKWPLKIGNSMEFLKQL